MNSVFTDNANFGHVYLPNCSTNDLRPLSKVVERCLMKIFCFGSRAHILTWSPKSASKGRHGRCHDRALPCPMPVPTPWRRAHAALPLPACRTLMLKWSLRSPPPRSLYSASSLSLPRLPSAMDGWQPGTKLPSS